MEKLQHQQRRVAAIYVRVSTDKQEREGISLEAQENSCRAYATQHSFAIAEPHVYRETWTGGHIWQRQEFLMSGFCAGTVPRGAIGYPGSTRREVGGQRGR